MATWKKVVVESAAGEISQDTTGNSATVTTNANLTGHITSSGNAAVLGSFTVAQLSTALSDASISGNNTGDQTTITGNAGTATALASAQNFSITGDVTASAVSFDGTGAVALNTSLAADAVGNAELDLVTGNSAANGNILSYSTDSGGDFKWIANTSAANDSTVTLAAGTGLSGGGNFTTNQGSGSTVTFNVDFGEFTDTAVTVADDFIVFLDGSGTGAERKESIADLVTAMTGTNLTSQAGVLQLTANPDISGTLDVTGNATFDSDVTVTGDLTVNGDTTTVSTTNLLVEDTFISLNSGGATNIDAGIVFEGAANKVFGWDQSQESGRFGVDYAGGDASAAGGGFTPDAWLSTVHTAAGATGQTAALAQIGNMYVNSSNQDIYIYS